MDDIGFRIGLIITSAARRIIPESGFPEYSQFIDTNDSEIESSLFNGNKHPE
jgi:hypothetical protein